MNTNQLETNKISNLVLWYAFSSINSLLVNSFYNMTDRFFIGRGVVYLGNVATNVILPLTVFMMALAVMLGDGAAVF